MREKMTPKERFLGILQGKEVDRLFVSPLILNFASRSLGLKIRDFCTNGKTWATPTLPASKIPPRRRLHLFSTTSTVAEAMGTKMHFPEDDSAG